MVMLMIMKLSKILAEIGCCRLLMIMIQITNYRMFPRMHTARDLQTSAKRLNLFQCGFTERK